MVLTLIACASSVGFILVGVVMTILWFYSRW